MNSSKLIICIVSALLVFGCAGTNTFPLSAREGDTVAITAGMKHTFNRDSITVTLTPTIGETVVYPPGASQVRSVVNLYPDPLASLIISDQKNIDITEYAQTYAGQLRNNFTGGDEDYWQTVVFIDLPVPLSGLTNVNISSSGGESVDTMLNVIADSGSPDPFEAELAGPLAPFQLQALERIDHYVVSFSGSIIPSAIQLDLAYSTLNGYLVNPRGDLKNLVWSDSGSGYRVILTRANGSLEDMQDFKFYVAIAFGVSSSTSLGVVPDSVLAFDENGIAIPGITADVKLVEGTAGLIDI